MARDYNASRNHDPREGYFSAMNQ